MIQKDIKIVRIGLLLIMLTLCFGIGLGISFGIAEDSYKNYIEQGVTSHFSLHDEKSTTKIWRYAQRAHFHATGISAFSLGLVLLILFSSLKDRMKKISAIFVGLGGLYPLSWFVMFWLAPEMGRSAAHHHILTQLFVYIGVGSLLLGMLILCANLFQDSFLRGPYDGESNTQTGKRARIGHPVSNKALPIKPSKYQTDLRNKTVVLTGATGGIGACIALELRSRGANLILIGRDENRMKKLRKDLNLPKQDCTYIVADIATDNGRQSVQQYCTDLESGFDVLINCAGANSFHEFSQQDGREIEKVIGVNLTATMLLTQGLLPSLMKSVDSRIINVGSAFGSIGYPGFVAYSASKFGLRGFSEALRRELNGTSVSVSYIAPRATRTALSSSNIIAMNEEQGIAMDNPTEVANDIVNFIEKERAIECYLGWPERFFVKVNGLFPRLVDNAISKQLNSILRYARMEIQNDQCA